MMLSWHDHLMIVPIVLPMLVAGFMLLLGEGARRRKPWSTWWPRSPC